MKKVVPVKLLEDIHFKEGKVVEKVFISKKREEGIGCRKKTSTVQNFTVEEGPS